MSTLKAIKSSFERSYDKQIIILVVLSNSLKARLVNFIYEPRHEKTGFCICENKDADQLRGNREADQRLCFR